MEKVFTEENILNIINFMFINHNAYKKLKNHILKLINSMELSFANTIFSSSLIYLNLNKILIPLSYKFVTIIVY